MSQYRVEYSFTYTNEGGHECTETVSLEWEMPLPTDQIIAVIRSIQAPSATPGPSKIISYADESIQCGDHVTYDPALNIVRQSVAGVRPKPHAIWFVAQRDYAVGDTVEIPA
jgi:hypothetical protein